MTLTFNKTYHKSTRDLNLSSEIETHRLAKCIAPILTQCDLVTLSGELGVGKTTFARSLIRVLANRSELTVTSPTFLLLQEYEGKSCLLVHADFYRLISQEELTEIGFSETLENAITIVEWPERCPELIENATVAIKFKLVSKNHGLSRVASLTAETILLSFIFTEYHILTLLDDADWRDTLRELIAGDASGRRYERIINNVSSAVLMIVPPTNPDQIIRANKTYREIAKLSVSLDTFVAVANGLLTYGFSAPKILKHDLQNGLILTEDLGSEPIYNDDGPIVERYEEAVRFLGTLHQISPPQHIPNYDGTIYQIPRYDTEALLIEAELFIDWYIPNLTDYQISKEQRANFLDIWKGLLEPLQSEPHGWTLRDFHSPNILWLRERSCVKRIGLIDIQDTVWGHHAYDLVSLLQDARVPISNNLELDLYELYIKIKFKDDANFDAKGFSKSYAIYALQRVTKVLGIFVRLKLRDNKPEYLKFIPQLIFYLNRNISHPALFEYLQWLNMNCPSLLNKDIGKR